LPFPPGWAKLWRHSAPVQIIRTNRIGEPFDADR
jgi:hypothetical protein